MAEDKTNPKDKAGIKKPRLSLVSPHSILYEAMAMQNGAEKYGPYNWRGNAVRADIYVDACMRHLLQWFHGEETAQDSGVHHLAHAKGCLGILIDALETGNLIDNRPPIADVSGTIEKLSKKD